MSNLNDHVNMDDINTILMQVNEAYTNGRITNDQYINIIQTFKNILNLVIKDNSAQAISHNEAALDVKSNPIDVSIPNDESISLDENNTVSGGFLNKLMYGGDDSKDTSTSTLNFDKDDSINQEISLKGGYDYLYNPTKKSKFIPTASYHAKKSFTNTDLNNKINEESNSLTGGALNNYFNKLIESTLKNKKVKGGNFDDEFNGGKKRKTCKKNKSIKGGEDESEEEIEEKSEEKSKNESNEEKEDEETKDEETEEEKETHEEEPRTSQDSDADVDNIIADDDDEDIKPFDPDEILGGKSQLQPYHDKIVENITKYLNKYEPDLEGEDKDLKGKQIKRLLNVLYYKSDENTSMEDRIKQLEDIADKTSTEAKLKKIITSNKTELDSIIDSWVKPEPKKKNKKNKAKKNKVFSDTTEESIEIKNNKKNNKKKDETTETATESSINGNIVDTASMIDSVIMGGRKKSALKRNLFNY